MKDLTSLNWLNVHASVNNHGYAHLQGLFSPETCKEIISCYDQSPLFRSVIDMKRYRFGMGEYKYFGYPLPKVIQDLREKMYVHLVPLANEWMKMLGIDTVYPERHAEFLTQCADHNQLRPTPLLLSYSAGGFNTLHQDLYGDVYFPFQIVVVLTDSNKDHTGGEFVLTEQIPRAQSRAKVITPAIGDAVIFATNFRPVKGTRGYYRAAMKHGVSEVRSGKRFSLGIIFHDAK